LPTFQPKQWFTLHAPIDSGKDDTYQPNKLRTIMSEEEDKTRIVRIQGETELLFLALCGESFEWQDNA
jgi:hypothetical protein